MSLFKPGHWCQSPLSSTFMEPSYNKNNSSQAYYLQAFFYKDFITHSAGLAPPKPPSPFPSWNCLGIDWPWSGPVGEASEMQEFGGGAWKYPLLRPKDSRDIEGSRKQCHFSPGSFSQVAAGVVCRQLWQQSTGRGGTERGCWEGAGVGGVEGGTAEALPARKAASAGRWGRKVVNAPLSSRSSPGSGLSPAGEAPGTLMPTRRRGDQSRDLLASSSRPPSLPLCAHSHKTHSPAFTSQPGHPLTSPVSFLICKTTQGSVKIKKIMFAKAHGTGWHLESTR